ncbi:SpaH/EbpB family LPXTG-anchored major pilin [Corynebacterium glutamicum]|uniref:SpaH/EbpB family LPXTG-anchored major pilin n=1 Tax=Corynebacterium glutamicum TaxID=1718 RepID=UPI001466800E|nr:SpaH/EbpB family LPXTG-anchored major pilin [Corynebacterium glutamicum]GFK17613.1 hypothetical protein KbCgl_01850 [Corynebacterium glutamicum]
MFNPKKRGFLVKAAAVLTAVALTVGASPSHAQETTYGPESSNVVITKLDQPTEAGDAADGTDQTPDGTRINGVTFKAYKVPLTADEGTEAWQQEIAGTSVDAASLAVNNAEPAITPLTGTTGADGASDGVINWNDVPRGLYLVRETATPSGVVSSPDFLLAVPLTNPDDLGTWLDTIYVYPKNSVVSGTKTVENATDFVTGNIVTWTINADIPQIRNQDGSFLPTDRFEIWDTLTDAELTLENGANSVKVIAPVGLTLDTHYEVDLDTTTVEGSTIAKVVFNSDGRDVLAASLPDSNKVIVTLDTIVNTVGEIDNKATVYPSDDADSSYSTDPVEVRYGNITLQKDSTESDADLEGAEFMVYLSEEAAIAQADGTHVTTSSNSEGVWTTTADGSVRIEGLRYSYFANGEVDNEGPLAQKYWLVETKALEGHQLLAEPIEFEVTSFDGSNVYTVTNSANTNGFVLPLTGGTGTALLTLLGVILLGVVLFVARTRRNSEAA